MTWLAILCVALGAAVLILAAALFSLARKGGGHAVSLSVSDLQHPAREDPSEESLFRRQKLEVLGEVAGGVIHDFNNTLTSILGYGELIVQVSPEGTAQRQYADAMVRSAGKAIKLVKQVKVFSRSDESPPQPVSVHKVLGDVMDILRSVLAKTIRVSLDLQATRDIVHGRPATLLQLFLNLAVNGRDAMDQGGELLLRTETVEDFSDGDGPEDTLRRGILVRVQDTGQGMDAETLHRIFEPFFTTKRTGTGLGLAVVRRAVEELGGLIQVRSEPGKGTAFDVVLPVSRKGAHFDSTVGEIMPGKGFVLLVDDDEAVLDAVSEMLENLGYTVRPFARPSDALAFFRDGHEGIDVVLLDVDMPEMDGIELYRRLKETDPAVKAFLFTAKDTARMDPSLFDPDLLGVLQKPLGLADISQKLRKALQST